MTKISMLMVKFYMVYMRPLKK